MNNVFNRRNLPLNPAQQLIAILGIAVLAIAGCSSKGDGDGVVVNEITLPTDTLLNLNCPNVGIFIEQCVLEDPENPFMNAGTAEFNVNDPDAETKFDLFNKIPQGPTGAKARFYLWATALARRASGENQWYTAVALHELYTAAGDPIIRDQALKAYRSVWDNFFGSVTVFECCGEFFPFEREDTAFAIPLNELTLERLVRAQETPSPVDPETGQPFYPNGYTPLIPDDPNSVGNDPGLIELETQEVILEWGYNYRCTGSGNDRLCVVQVSIF